MSMRSDQLLERARQKDEWGTVKGSLPMGNPLGVHRHRKSREWVELEAECGFPYFSVADEGDLQSKWREVTLKRGCFVLFCFCRRSWPESTEGYSKGQVPGEVQAMKPP